MFTLKMRIFWKIQVKWLSKYKHVTQRISNQKMLSYSGEMISYTYLLYSIRATIIPFIGSRAGSVVRNTLYIYIYIFRWWMDTVESVSPKGRLRLDGVCCDWAFALL